VDVGVAKDAMVHVGAHLVAWSPRVLWGSKGRAREIVDEGVGYLVEGYAATQGGSGDHSSDHYRSLHLIEFCLTACAVL